MTRFLDNSIKWYYDILISAKEYRLNISDDSRYTKIFRRKESHNQDSALFDTDIEMANYLFGLEPNVLEEEFCFALFLHISHMDINKFDIALRKLKLYKIKNYQL